MALTKEESIARVKRLISLQLRDATHRHLFTMHGIRGKVAHDRLMRIARQSLVETAFDTQAHRDILEREAEIPTSVFFDRVNITGWTGLKLDVFYETDANWKAQSVATMPSASDITNEQLHELLGYSGGGGEGSDNPFPESHDISVADRRLQKVCEWAVTEYPKASVHSEGNQGVTADDRNLRDASSVFRGLIYHTVWLALNSDNLTDTKWELLKHNLRDWQTFAKHLSDNAIRTLYFVDNRFYDGTHVWLWNALDPHALIRVRNSMQPTAVFGEISELDANALPDFGLTTDHYTVREILGLRHPFPYLSDFNIVDQEGNAVDISPEFDSNGSRYTADIASTVTELVITATPTSDLMAVTIEGDLTLPTARTRFTITVDSEDGEVRNTYRLTVTKATEDE